ncbi:hypothetical protein [Nocardia donostiensis]|uniref:D-apionate lactonase C-terminal domain-containing protein n=1 Tax=Nocardia donostiensis TaxID=1538463 RepID=A0A1V2TKP4_9NOCA|nr:hypothetical protein [Nocardia donostiensis]ONM49921.1 hypothetical protein B0T46_05990 [Nocardia donostiensis]OQS22129.1 hypothetical protein B0T44_05550 [Nocardia donostiensis]
MTDAPALLAPPPHAPAIPVTVDWDHVGRPVETVLTTHLWTAPPLARGAAAHDRAFEALRDLRVDYARFLPWFSNPLVSVPALTAPTDTATSWDFGRLDPYVEDFVAAAEGRPVVANFATIPHWMFVGGDEVEIGDDPDVDHWDYERGTEFRDETLAEVADYFYRIASWYIAGGFHDEHGVWHESGHRYRFAYWEVLCEPDLNRGMSPQTYTRLYDAVVERLRPLDPQMRFIGLSLSHVHHNPEYFWYFLDPANHAPGIPLDAFSIHYYASPDIVNPFGPEGNPAPQTWESTFFAQAEGFLEQVRYIRSIAKRLSPDTKMLLNEIGTYPSDIMNPVTQLPAEYWALSATVHTYLWARCLDLDIALFGVAEFNGYPGMIPGTSLVDWETGEPNARYHATKLMVDHVRIGDRLLPTDTGHPGFPDPRVHARAVVAADGTRMIVLVNKRGVPVELEVTDWPDRSVLRSVDAESPTGAPRVLDVHGGRPTLPPYACAVLIAPPA